MPKHARSHKRASSKSRKNRSRRSRKGGMLNEVVSAARTALLPFLLYKAQKRTQRRVSRKNRTQRRRR